MKFGKSLSIADFKDQEGIKKLQVAKNPKTDKLFLVGDGKVIGSVSKNYDPNGNNKEVVLLTELDEDGSTMWCLHNNNSDNIIEEL